MDPAPAADTAENESVVADQRARSPGLARKAFLKHFVTFGCCAAHRARRAPKL